MRIHPHLVAAAAPLAVLTALAADPYGTRAAEPVPVAAPSPPGPDALLDMIVAWLAAGFELAPDFDHPEIAIASPEALAALRYGTEAVQDPDTVVAVYEDATRTIHLGPDWDGRTPEGLSVLVHEMVHHLQHRIGQTFACPGEREAVAYRAQEAWLALFGLDLETAFSIDRMTLMLRTTCGY